MARRLAAAAPWALALVWSPVAVWSLFHEPGRLVVARQELSPPRWPSALAGLRVLAVSDIHAGAPHVGAEALRRLVALANAERPDLVALLGDYVIHGVPGGRFVAPEETARELGGLRARLGVFAVLGNHDHWLDARRVRTAFEAAGIAVIDERAVPVEADGGRLFLVGIRDIWTGWPDIKGLLAKVPPGAPVLALTHNPDVFPFLPDGVDLLLAGHTHGGQVRLPLLGTPIVPSTFGQRYARGHVVEHGRHLFVTSGVGTSVLPVRFRVPPEIAVVTIRPGAGR